MKLKNYTSSVPVERSAMLIETLLVEAGAHSISKIYKNKRLSGFTFQIPTSSGDIDFKLPTNTEAAKNIMFGKTRARTKKQSDNQDAQSQRTAWKILYEWVQIQIAMIQMGQVEATQVFLPYAYDRESKLTFFEKIQGGGFKMLEAGDR